MRSINRCVNRTRRFSRFPNERPNVLEKKNVGVNCENLCFFKKMNEFYTTKDSDSAIVREPGKMKLAFVAEISLILRLYFL